MDNTPKELIIKRILSFIYHKGCHFNAQKVGYIKYSYLFSIVVPYNNYGGQKFLYYYSVKTCFFKFFFCSPDRKPYLVEAPWPLYALEPFLIFVKFLYSAGFWCDDFLMVGFGRNIDTGDITFSRCLDTKIEKRPS